MPVFNRFASGIMIFAGTCRGYKQKARRDESTGFKEI
jgi:hypothetical protein